MQRRAEVIVIGAGAAGLSCAQKLEESGIETLLLEARGRVGGRIWSQEDPELRLPVELGAEFLHGAPQEIFDLFQAMHIPFYDVKDAHLSLQEGKLKELPDFWERIDKLNKKIKRFRKDMNVEQFLAKVKTDKFSKSLFAAFIEGFQSADLKLMGIRAVDEGKEEESEELNGSSLFRPLVRYDSFLQRLSERLGAETLHLETKLKSISWEKGDVELKCVEGPTAREVTYRCNKLVLTLPIGVLKSQGIEWNDFPKSLQDGLAFVHMGHVQKIAFRFRTRFWEELSDKPVSFLHTGPEFYFPTWWSMQPVRGPYLVAWQGGPKAAELSKYPEERRIELALQTLSRMCKLSVGHLNSQVVAYNTHDWSNDPLAYGAYSYIGVDGVKAARALQKPIEHTLFFAGEGMTMGSGRGTVHGAFRSGLKAAESVFAATRNSKASTRTEARSSHARG